MRRSWALLLSVVLIVLGLCPDRSAVAADVPGPVEVTPTVRVVLTPVRSADFRLAVQLSKAQRETMHRHVLERRERNAALVDNDPPSPPGRESPLGRETQPRSQGAFHGTPSSLNVLKNVLNPIAQDGNQSTILEPTTVNEGNTAIYTGNWFFSYSTNGGANWTEEGTPGGTASAPFFCCDIDSIYDPARGIFIWSALYCSDILCTTTGSVLIFVRRTASGGNTCTYELDYTALFGELPDYPRIGISNKFLYLSVNSLTSGGAAWSAADMWRVDLDQIADCASSATASIFSYVGTVGQRAFIPGTNAQHAMYWATNENTTQLRVFKWPETSTSVQQFLRTVSPTTFANSNCIGGTNGRGVFTNTTAWSIAGFPLRTATGGPRVLVLWSAAADAGHSNAYIRGADFQEPNLVLISQPDIYSSSHCYNHPAVVGSERDGHYGLAVLFGGKVGSGGPGLNAAVGIDDDYTTGIGVFDLMTVTTGTHNPEPSSTVPAGRVGDFVSVQRHRPCGLSAFVAAVYELNGGGDETSVRGRYVEFVRNRDRTCYERWKDVAPGAFPP
jgi:hypothetical protein